MVAVPLALMIGFAAFIFFMFMKDDHDAASILKVAFIVMFFGLGLIAAHYGLQQLN